MRIRAFRVTRRAMLAAGALAAGGLVGCQTAGPQFARPGVARGDGGATPMSPAFAQVRAGQQLANGSAMPAGQMAPAMNGTTVLMTPGMSMPAQPMAAPGAAVMGSGGMVHPVAYSPAGPTQLTMPTTAMATPAMMYPQTVVMQPSAVMPTVTTMPANSGQPTYVLVNGPNGPQYVMIQEMVTTTMPAPAATTPAMPAPTVPGPGAPPTAAPPTAAPAVPAPAISPAPAPNPAATPESAPIPPVTPVSTIPAPDPAPVGPPKFSAPAPVEAKPAPAKPSEESARVPDPLPTSVNIKPPTGPVLPASDMGGPSLGSFPAAPAVSAPAPVKLPPAHGVSDDFIPPAPVFLPAVR